MDDEGLLWTILAKLDRLERLISDGQRNGVGSTSVQSSFSPGGKDWFLTATDEERRAFNRQRGQASRRGRK
ncbi:MAG: hypothetical protein Q4G66_02560 [bacterium]|nr:hypothetical protein [bacterium]